MSLPKRSPLAEYVAAMWGPVCLAAAIVPKALDATAVAGIVLVGLTLLTYEKDRRYPRLSWSAASRTFFETHTWSTLFVWMTLATAFVTLWRMPDSDPRGICVLGVTAYALLWLGAPIRQRVLESTTMDPHATGTRG